MYQSQAHGKPNKLQKYPQILQKKKKPIQSKSLNQKSLKALYKKKNPKANLKTIMPQSLRVRATPFEPQANRRRSDRSSPDRHWRSVQSRSSSLSLVARPHRRSLVVASPRHCLSGLSLQASLLGCSGAPSLKVFRFFILLS